MHWVSTFLALALTGALQVEASDATILTFSPGTEDSLSIRPKQQTLSEDEARLVLELRMQSSVASVLGMVDADTVDHLNQFAEAGSTLFGGSSGAQTPGKSVLILEGVDQQNTLILQKSQPSHIIVPRVSSQFVGADLLGSFTEGEDIGQYCEYHANAEQSARGCLFQDPMLAGQSGLFDRASLATIDSVEDWTSKDRKDSILKLSFKDSGDSLEWLESLLLRLAESSSTSKREITTVILPQSSQSTTLGPRGAKRSSSVGRQNVFGRSAQDSSLHSTLAPICHASNSSCAETTNHCSGHGSCYLKYGTGLEGTTGNCYACKCQQSVIKNSDGTTKTVQWGGAACQKRDISSPFFLVAGVSLLAILLVGSAIGMLFSMGSQELPSVISAGVGGPKNQM
ncbi:uncharacterized protein N7529_004414 [Penicillium soppii]|uniref:uncharacterized protein n=1 Tax=Penicillium soppii TaxID=69789 RepID=UPI00254681D8|nr:uncharacterized protein N7529_004414 [Penicillium soppii]KAJ5872061.1 hypothetical protein N7529_004414 [Penicillium soppii]